MKKIQKKWIELATFFMMLMLLKNVNTFEVAVNMEILVLQN